MAQRYGRRRRRAHREQIEQLQKDVVGLKVTLRSATNDIMASYAKLSRFEEMMAEWDADVRTMLGPYSAFLFAPGTFLAHGDPTLIQQIPLPADMSPLLSPDELPSVNAIAMRVAYLKHCIISIISDEKFKLDLQTHMRLEITGEGKSYVSFSEQYWQSMGGASERDINYLALKIARDMFEKIKKNGPSARRRA